MAVLVLRLGFPAAASFFLRGIVRWPRCSFLAEAFPWPVFSMCRRRFFECGVRYSQPGSGQLCTVSPCRGKVLLRLVRMPGHATRGGIRGQLVRASRPLTFDHRMTVTGESGPIAG